MQEKRRLFTRDRSFYHSFFKLCSTLMIEQAVILSVNLVDNIMIGGYSEIALAGVAAVNQIQFVFQQMVYAASSGLMILSSQYWGEGRREPIPKLCIAGLALAGGIALLFLGVTSLWPGQVLGMFTAEKEIISSGAEYLRIIRFTYPIFALTTLLLGAMRSVENVRIGLRVSFLSLLVNCSINYALIEGRLGAPEMGVQGAAIGTLVARVLECAIVLYYVLRKDTKLQLRGRAMLRMDWDLWRDYGKITAPILVTGTLWGSFNVIQTIILGRLSAHAMAAYSISSTVFLLLKVTAVGASTAATIIIGKEMGRGALQTCKEYVRTLQCLFLSIGMILGVTLFFLRIPILALYDISAATRQMANAFFAIQSVVICMMSYQMPVNTGIIRGGGDTKFVMYLDLVSIWAIVLPLSCLGAFVFHWSPIAVVLCLNADQIFKCIPAAIRVNRYHWARRLTRPAQDKCAERRQR